MWKTIVLCASLFGGAALGLAAVARWIEATAMPATAAIGLCLIGVVLILAAPPGEMEEVEEDELPGSTTVRAPTPPQLRAMVASASGSVKALVTPAPENRPLASAE